MKAVFNPVGVEGSESSAMGVEAMKAVFNPNPVGVDGTESNPNALCGVEGTESIDIFLHNGVFELEPPSMEKEPWRFIGGAGAPGHTIVRQCVVATLLGVVTLVKGVPRCMLTSHGVLHCVYEIGISSAHCRFSGIVTCICGLKICSGSCNTGVGTGEASTGVGAGEACLTDTCG